MRRIHSAKNRPIDVPIFLQLPTPTRWRPREKAAVVLAVRYGFISLPDACNRYLLTVDEFEKWETGFNDEGLAGLHLKRQVSKSEKSRSRGRRPKLG
jgi:hypothetical protein